MSDTATTTAAPGQEALSPGRVIQIIGPVVDVEFPPEHLPEVNFALLIDREVEGVRDVIVAEVAQHVGASTVRAICMKPTDGLRRGAVVRNTGAPITVPVGNVTLGHVWTVTGESLDAPGIEVGERWPIRRDPPAFEELESKTEMFETGIKV